MDKLQEIENESILIETDFDPETERQEILREFDRSYAKEYYKKNKDYWKAIINCECGARVDHSHLSRHRKTKKHILACPVPLELEPEPEPEEEPDPETVDQQYLNKLSEYQARMQAVESKIKEMKKALSEIQHLQNEKVFQKWINTRISRVE